MDQFRKIHKAWWLLFVAFILGIAVDSFQKQPEPEYQPGDESYANMPTYDDWPGEWQYDQSSGFVPLRSDEDTEPRIGALPEAQDTIRY